MFCDVCRRIGLSQDAQAELISAERTIITHHHRYASLCKSVSLRCFVCVRLWNALTSDEQIFVAKSSDMQSNSSNRPADISTDDTVYKTINTVVTTARSLGKEPTYYMWHSGDRLLQTGFQSIPMIPGKRLHYRVELNLADSKLLLLVQILAMLKELFLIGTQQSLLTIPRPEVDKLLVHNV